ncbi:MAG: filamentous hemagglutinin N-terminal domain-containing protein [Elainellaceae cyanobacterium]
MLAIAALKSCRCRYFLALIAVAMLFPGGAKAQVIPDGTLGPESSLLLPNGVTVEGAAADLIRAGARRGENLFHSFERFSIGEGQRVYFENPAGVARVFSRVTGETRSDILGTLGSLGGADLFLLNPNGIVFGPNARLNVGGSFVASTGDRVTFADGREFSAVPQASELLSINVPLGVQFNASAQGDIVNQGSLEAGLGQSLTLFGRTIENSGQLTARSGGDIVLVTPQTAGSSVLVDGGVVNTNVERDDVTPGGNISMTTHDLTVQNDGIVTASTLGQGDAGRIDIGATGTVTVDGERSTIASQVGQTSTGNSGGIAIAARNITVLNAGEISASTFGAGNSGLLEVNVTEAIRLDGFDSHLTSRVEPSSTGDSSGIRITTGDLFVLNGALVGAETRGEGNSGLIEIVAAENVRVEGQSSFVSSRVDLNGTGDSGGISIATGSLSVVNDGEISASTFSEGNSGLVEITATEDVRVDGQNSFLTSRVDPSGTGDSGGIRITTGNLFVLDGALVGAVTFGDGNSGLIEIVAAEDVRVAGANSFISSRVESVGTGNSGGISIAARNLSVIDDGEISASTFGEGNSGLLKIDVEEDVRVDGQNSFLSNRVGLTGTGSSGGITITTGDLFVLNGGAISAGTFNQGSSGQLEITAEGQIVLDGDRLPPSITNLAEVPFTPDNVVIFDSLSTISSIVGFNATGDSGSITIQAEKLSVLNDSLISATTISEGDSGQVRITAGEVVVDGTLAAISSEVFPIATGDSGGIDIVTTDLSVRNDGSISADTFGEGNAGPMRIEAGAISLSSRGSEISTETVSSGNGGGIQIVAPRSLTIDGPGRIAVETSSTGEAGDIEIRAERLTLSEDVLLSASTSGPGLAGDITFNLAEDLRISNGGRIFAATAGSGTGGTITLNAAEAVRIGEGVQDFEPIISVEASDTGRPGNIAITTPRFVLSETARITATATETAANLDGGGSITLSADQMDLAGVVGIFAETQGQAPGGVLTLQPYQNNPNLDVTLAAGSLVSASTSGSGRGGGLVIQAPEAIAISGPGRLQVETSGTGRAGDIEVSAQRLSLEGGVTLSASTTGLGQAGDITLHVSDSLELDGSVVESSTGLESAGQGGSIRIATGDAVLRNGSRIAVDSAGSGQGGNVTLGGDRLILTGSSRITATTSSSDGGNLAFNLQDVVLLLERSELSTTAGTDGAGGDGGDITLTTPFLVSNFSEDSDITANAFDGSGGNVRITATGGIFGIAPRPFRTPASDITASSENGVSGDITIQSPEVDPSRSTAELPSAFTASDVVESCRERFAATGSSFVVTGRGGIPQGPQDPQLTLLWQDALPVEAEEVPGEAAPQDSSAVPTTVVEAQGWIRNAHGEVVLLAEAPQPAAVGQPVGCQG